MSVTRPVTQRVTQPVTLPVTIGAPTSALPIPLTAPVITGTTFVGDMLTVTPGTYLNATTVTGEWYVDGVATGVTNLTYVVDVDDAGLLIEWREEASNSYGSTQQTASVTAETLLANVQHLYANGEQGALYYFTEDFAGLYQDAAGTTPVTAEGQPVGLMLDRRFGLARGPELVSDPDLSDPGEWLSTSPSVVPSGGVVTFTEAATAAAVYTTDPNTLIADGRWYEIEVVVDSLTSGVLRASAGRGSGITFPISSLSVGRNVLYGRATGTGGQAGVVSVYTVGTTNAVVSRISAREVPGNHASQATTTARPTLQRDANGKLHLAFDGVDDCLVVSSIVLPQPWERVSTFRQNSWKLGANLFRQVGGNGGLVYQNGTSPNVSVSSGAVVPAGNLPVGTVGCLSERHNSTVSRVALAGLSPIGPVNMGALDSVGMNIGAQNTGSSNSAHVDFYGIVVRSGLLPDAQRQAAEGFVASRAGIDLGNPSP